MCVMLSNVANDEVKYPLLLGVMGMLRIAPVMVVPLIIVGAIMF